MNKRVSVAAAAVILGLAFATLTIAPAQGATSWATLKSELESATVGATVPMVSLAVNATNVDSTISITTSKTLSVAGASSITTLFAGSAITVASGATLTINGGGDLSAAVVLGNAVFAGAGTVVLSGANLTTSSSSNVFAGTGAFTSSSGTTIVLGRQLTSSTGVVTLNGAATRTGAFSLPDGTNLTIGTTGNLSVIGAIVVGTTVGGGVVFNNSGTMSATLDITNWGRIRFSGSMSTLTGIINNGAMVPLPGSFWSVGPGGIDGNSWVVEFGTGSTDYRSVFATGFTDAEQTLPWNTAWDNFMGWQVGSTIIYGSTPFSGTAPYVVFSMDAHYGAFETAAPVVGTALTGYTGGLPTSVYTWSLDGTPFASSTSPGWTPIASQVGHVLSLNVHTTLQGYSPATSDYNRSFGVVSATFATAPPTVSGLAAVGSTLVADATASFTPAAGAITYEWFSNSVSVGTGATYVLASTDLGHSIKVVATGTKPNYVTATAEKIVGTIAAQPVITLGITSPTEGDTITISTPGLAANTDYRVELHSTPVVLATLHTTSAGLLSGSLTVPLGTLPGAHSIVLYDPNGNPVTSADLAVSALPAVAALAVTGMSALIGVGGLGAGGLLVLGLLLMVGRRRATARA